jgi:hypothetical protein
MPSIMKAVGSPQSAIVGVSEQMKARKRKEIADKIESMKKVKGGIKLDPNIGRGKIQ